MSLRHNQIRKSELARALAVGRTVADWAKEKNVAERTAYIWSRCAEVLQEIDEIRSAALDQAIGRLSSQVARAADQITLLAEKALSEAVRLQASKAVMDELMAISSYATLERRMAEIERKLHGSPPRPRPDRRPDPPGRTRSATADRPSSQEDPSCPAC
jgi:hypothetical protein